MKRRHLSVEIIGAKQVDKYIGLKIKAYYAGKELELDDGLKKDNFSIGRIDMDAGEVDYSYGVGDSPDNMGYLTFGFDRSDKSWVMVFGPFPPDFEVGEILLRLDVKGHSVTKLVEVPRG